MKRTLAVALMTAWTVVNVASVVGAGYVWRHAVEARYNGIQQCTQPPAPLRT